MRNVSALMAIEIQPPQPSVAPVRMSFWDYLKAYESVEGVQAEWVAGEVELYPMGNNTRHQDLLLFFATLFSVFVARRRLGKVMLAGLPMYLGEDQSARQPDLLVILTEHLDLLKETYLDGPADLVMEIVSPESDKRDHGPKFVEYEVAGIPEYWLIDPIRRRAEVNILDSDGHYQIVPLDEHGRLVSLVLPGFAVEFALLWQVAIPDAAAVISLVEQMG